MNRNSTGLGIVLLVGWMLPVSPVSAQSVLEEIVVTADRREANIQDVSISMFAFTGEEISDLGIENASDLAAQVPGLEVRENGMFPGYFIRGAGVQTETNDINEQPVNVYVDEVYLAAPSAQRGQLFDLERAEVLRGPQGTLFGRNTPGGLVHFISRKPTDKFEGYIEGQYGSFDQRIFEGAVNLPVNERVRARASVKYNADDGWQEDRFTGTEFSDNDILSGRVQLDVDLAEDLSLLLKFDGMRQRNAGLRYGFSGLLDPITRARCSLDRVNNQECVAVNGYGDPDNDDEKIATDTDPVDDIDSWGIAGTLTWAITDAITATSITAYRELEREWAVDGDATPVLIFGLFNFDTYRTTDSYQFSQEVRFNGTAGNADWVFGGYYFDDNREFLNQFPSFGLGDFTDIDTLSWAIFGQIDLRITETLTFIGGARYTDEEKDAIKFSRDRPANVFNPVLEDQPTTGKVGFEWRPLDDLMLYASLSTGFKSGTFAARANDIVVEPEKATAYEGGARYVFWNDRARLNASLYFYEYKDFQATGTEINEFGIPVNRLTNVGKLEILGLEGDFAVLPMENLELVFGFNFTSGEIKTDPAQASGARDYETGVPFFFDGNDPAHLPDYSLNGVVRYALPIDPAWGDLTLQADWKYSGEMSLDSDNNRLHRQDDYGTVGLRAVWNSADEKWYAQVFGSNLTDTQVAGWSFDISGFVWNRSTVWGQRPRSAGIKVGMRF
jgi:iron complex outermembrane receptor protein